MFIVVKSTYIVEIRRLTLAIHHIVFNFCYYMVINLFHNLQRVHRNTRPALPHNLIRVGKPEIRRKWLKLIYVASEVYTLQVDI
jgi:hypothetical protein